jgi:hypothetical protein
VEPSETSSTILPSIFPNSRLMAYLSASVCVK